ncbi:sperm flagellar protein 1 isoform X4 [Ciconia boyciana]|uniref:sperm flagellar protein 1 isoform X4 n=1 Tax=Ciconia boyciana TaxID=52775 RepID=UPI003BA1D55D
MAAGRGAARAGGCRMAGGGAAGEPRGLYRWLDAVPLSRPRRNIARDFSDGVLAAEVVKFFFPAMVQLHSYVPASSTPQKLTNWGHLNRTVLSKLNFSIPDDVIQQVVQCRPGTAEQVLLLLRQKIEEKQKQSKEPGVRAALEEVSYLETDYSKAKSGAGGGGYAQESPGAAGVKKSHHGCAQPPPGDAAVRLQLAEREQALLLAQETIQVSPPSVTPAKRCPRGSTEAGTDSLCLPNQPATVVDVSAQTGVCSTPSTSWAAPVSVPGSGGTLGHGPAWRWLCRGPAGQRLARVLLWLLPGSAGLLKGLVRAG